MNDCKPLKMDSVITNNQEKYITQLTEIEKKKLLKNSKIVIGYRGIGHCGHSISVIKSALQKGVRRNDHQLVRWSLRETFLYYGMRDFKKCPSAAVAFNTNIINRMHTIAVEDCSPRALMATNECAENLKRYKTLKDSGPQYLMEAGICLCDCPSSRVCSHMRVLCSGGGPYHSEFDTYEQKQQVTIDERFQVIFDVHLLCGRLENAFQSSSTLRSLRAISAYHSLKIYHHLTDRDDYGNFTCKPITAAVKKKRFVKFWQKCFDTVRRLSVRDNFVRQYKDELNKAIKWRMEFFFSRNYFPEESLLLLSAVDLLIAVVHGPKDEFTSIQKQKQQQQTLIGPEKKFNWLTDHRTIDPMPRYVMDQHTSSPDVSVSFAMESSKVIDGDKSWSPVSWLHAYTAFRVRANEPVSSEDRALHVSAKAFIQLEAAKIVEKLKVANNRPLSIVVLPLLADRNITKSAKQSLITTFFQPSSTKRPFSLMENATPSSSKKRKHASDCVKNVESLPELKFEDIEMVIAVHNNNSKKAPVTSLRMVDKSLIVVKLMKKNFGYGIHQNFVQNLKDEKICDFKYLHPMPESGGGNYRGLMKGRFEIVKTKNHLRAEAVKISQNEPSNAYFVTGCVTQNGNVVDTRLSHCLNTLRDDTFNAQLVHIIAFRLLMGVNDTNHSNILVGEEMKLYSVDENYVGSKSHEAFLNTKGCKYLKTLLFRTSNNIEQNLLLLPSWMTNENQRRQMLTAIRIRGQKDGISEETLCKIEANSIGIREKLLNFLFTV